MPFQPVPDTALVQLVMAAGGINAQNTVYFRKEGGWDVGSLQVLAENCVLAWETNVAPVTTSDWALIEAVATNQEATDSTKQIWKPALPIQGEIVLPSGPVNASFAIKFGMPRRGRGISGRIFAVGLPEQEIGPGSITSAHANLLVAAWRDFATDVETAVSCEHVVVHRVINGIRPPTGTPEAVSSYSYTDLSLDSQKLRLPNHKKQKRPITP